MQQGKPAPEASDPASENLFDARLARHMLIAVSAGYFLLPFMLVAVNTVVPAVGAGLNAGAQDLGMIGAAYTMGMAVSQLAAGRIGDIYGRKRLFMCGIAVFGIAGLVLCTVPWIHAFIGIRFLQGLGAAMFNASGLALVAAVAPPDRRGKYIGITASAVFAGTSLGPPAAGFITAALGWRWLFLLCSVAAFGVFLLMRCTVRREWRICRGEPFDFSGCAVYTAAMAALTCSAWWVSSRPRTALCAFCLSLLFFGLFVRHEKRAAYPLLSPQMFTESRVFTLSALASVINFAAIFGVPFLLSLYLQTVCGMDVAHVGLLLSVQAAVQIACTAWAGGLADRKDPGIVSACGMVLCAASILGMLLLHGQESLAVLMGIQVLLGVGISLFAVPNTSLLLSSVPARFLGQASSVNGATRTAGMLFNMICVTATLAWFFGGESIRAEDAPAFLNAMHLDALFFGLLSLCAVGCALARQKKQGTSL